MDNITGQPETHKTFLLLDTQKKAGKLMDNFQFYLNFIESNLHSLKIIFIFRNLMFVWSAVFPMHKADWRCLSMEAGALFATIVSTKMTPKLSVVSLDLIRQ